MLLPTDAAFANLGLGIASSLQLHCYWVTDLQTLTWLKVEKSSFEIKSGFSFLNFLVEFKLGFSTKPPKK